MTTWTTWNYYENEPPSARDGSVSSLNDESGVVIIKHVLGFTREDWGEGNWTARDLR